METRPDTLTFYKHLLTSMHVIGDENGLLSYHFEDMRPEPITIGGKRLTLPLPEILRSGDWDGRIAFHPLSESFVRPGDSPVVRKLQGLISLRLTHILSELIRQLTAVAANRDGHKKLSPHAAELLLAMPEVDEKSVALFEKIVENVEMSGPNRLISLFIKRGGKLKGQSRQRIAVVSMPIMDQLGPDSDGIINGVKLRKKDLQALRGLMSYIMPDGGDPETYSAGSDSQVAPSFDALIHAYENVARRLNAVIHIQRKQLSNEKELHTDLDWVDYAEDLSQFRGDIPVLEGNLGESNEDAAARAATVTGKPAPVISAAKPIVAASETIKPASVAPTTKQEETTVKRGIRTNISREDYAPPRTTINWGAQSSTALQPIHAAPTTEPARIDENQVRHTKAGLDFRSVMEARNRGFHQGNLVPAVYQQAQAYVMPAVPVTPVAPVGSYANHWRNPAPTPYGMPAGYGAPVGEPMPDWALPAQPMAPAPQYGMPAGYGAPTVTMGQPGF